MEGSFVSPCLLQNPETHLTASVFLEGEFRGRRPPTLLTPSSSQSLQCSGAFRGRLCGKNRHREGLSMCVLTIPLVTAHARSSSQDLLKLGSFRERERESELDTTGLCWAMPMFGCGMRSSLQLHKFRTVLFNLTSLENRYIYIYIYIHTHSHKTCRITLVFYALSISFFVLPLIIGRSRGIAVLPSRGRPPASASSRQSSRVVAVVAQVVVVKVVAAVNYPKPSHGSICRR